MTITKQRLYGVGGVATLRSLRDAVDASDWTPDHLSAGEISGGVVADDVTLDAREWTSLRVIANYSLLGVPDPGGSVDIMLLMAIPDPTASNGRIWKELGTTITLTGTISYVVQTVDGHDIAARIDALTLGTADAVTLQVTS